VDDSTAESPVALVLKRRDGPGVSGAKAGCFGPVGAEVAMDQEERDLETSVVDAPRPDLAKRRHLGAPGHHVTRGQVVDNIV
jgi:hypothetical protein